MSNSKKSNIKPYSYYENNIKSKLGNSIKIISICDKLGFHGNQTRVLSQCTECDYKWETSLASLSQGHGCSQCSLKKLHQKHLIPLDVYREKLFNKFGNKLIIIGIGDKEKEFHGQRTTVKVHCNECDFTYETRLDSVLDGEGCSKCVRHFYITYDEYCKRIHSKIPSLTVKKITDKEGFHGLTTEVLVECSECGKQYKKPINRLLNSKSCIYCTNNYNPTFDDYKIQIESMEDNSLKVLGIAEGELYHGGKTIILVECQNCGKRYRTTITGCLQGKRCKECANKNLIIPLSEQIKRIEKIQGKNLYDFSLIKNYKGVIIKYPIICKKCGKIFKKSIQELLQGSRCDCSKLVSKGEKNIMEYFYSKNIKFESQKILEGCKDKGYLKFDFYLPDYNVCIEFDGEQHFRSIEYFGGQKEFEERQLHDNIKNTYCKNNNIGLLRIKYNENIEEKLNSFFDKIK